MRKFVSLFLIFTFVLAGCQSKNTLSEDEVKNLIYEYNKDAVIKSCDYNTDHGIYEIIFETKLDTYISYVNPKKRVITSITIYEEKKNDGPIFNDEPIENVSDSYISSSSAITIALDHSDAAGTAVIVKNELDEENNVYDIIFRSGNKEYSYVIDAITGDILLSEVEIDS